MGVISTISIQQYYVLFLLYLFEEEFTSSCTLTRSASCLSYTPCSTNIVATIATQRLLLTNSNVDAYVPLRSSNMAVVTRTIHFSTQTKGIAI